MMAKKDVYLEVRIAIYIFLIDVNWINQWSRNMPLQHIYIYVCVCMSITWYGAPYAVNFIVTRIYVVSFGNSITKDDNEPY